MEYKGKKLLILGATTETVFLVKKAEDLGVETYVADPFSNAPAKSFSSHPLDINCFDVDTLAGIIEKEHIDGILPGCADILVPVYEELCFRTGLHCYVNHELVAAFNNKKGMKDILRKFGLPVIEEYTANEVSAPDFSQYPVFIKPVDNNSSKGMSIVYQYSDFHDAYQKALDNSRSKIVLIEKYEQCDDFFIGYYLQDGNIVTTFTADRFTIQQKGYGSITSGITYPSKYQKLYFETVHEKMLQIFEAMHFMNGIIAIQGFVENNQIMFYDPALRITGGQEYIFASYFYDVDILKSLIQFSLTGRMSDNSEEYKKCDCTFRKQYACNLAFSVKPCTIGRIDGMDFARHHHNVLNVTQEHKEGDVIDKVGTAQQNISRMHIVAESIEEMVQIVKALQDNVIAYDMDGNNVMLQGLDIDNWRKHMLKM